MRISRQLVEEVAGVAPPGLGNWATAWEIVEESSRTFNLALGDFARSPSSVNGARIVAGARAVVTSWTIAARAWEASGEPAGKEGVCHD